MTRRTALGLGLAGAASAAIGAVGLTQRSWPRADTAGAGTMAAATGGAFREPQVLRSAGGVLDVELAASATDLRVGNRWAGLSAYNGTSPGPTLALSPGDLLRLRLVNQLGRPTNLHVHGLHVPPTGSGDDPMVSVAPGGSHQYEYEIPTDHPRGLFWYHPHRHGSVADQVFAGLFGAILLGDPPTPAEGPSRVLIISDLSLEPDGTVTEATPMDRMAGREGALLLVNGQRAPVLTVTADERWHVLNACTSRYLDLQLPWTDVTEVGRDGRPLAAAQPAAVVRVLPGGRTELQVARPPRETALWNRQVDRTGMGMGMGMGMVSARGSAPGSGGPRSDTAVPILTVLPADSPGPGASPASSGTRAPDRVTRTRDLRRAPVTKHRTIELGAGMSMGGMAFTIDGRSFDPARVDLQVRVGDVEEWTFTNTSMMSHPVHLHVWPMQVVEADGAPVPDVEWRDVVDVPAGGRTSVRIAFDDHAGATVLHCHILDHEDLGMMASVLAR